jgi:hypothetical protein
MDGMKKGYLFLVAISVLFITSCLKDTVAPVEEVETDDAIEFPYNNYLGTYSGVTYRQVENYYWFISEGSTSNTYYDTSIVDIKVDRLNDALDSITFSPANLFGSNVCSSGNEFQLDSIVPNLHWSCSPVSGVYFTSDIKFGGNLTDSLIIHTVFNVYESDGTNYEEWETETIDYYLIKD